MLTDIKKVLKQLEIEDTGTYDNHFYVLNINNSDDYAKMYTLLNKNAVNTEYPYMHLNTNKTTTKFTNYFEVSVENIDYNLFLIADFDENKYQLKIGEK